MADREHLQDQGALSGSRPTDEAASSTASSPSGFDPARLISCAKVLRELVASERDLGAGIALPEYKCEWVEEAAEVMKEAAIAMAPDRAHCEDNALPQDCQARAESIAQSASREHEEKR